MLAPTVNALRIVPLAAIAACFAAPARAADPDPAQTLFDRGLAGMEAGRYDEACPDIQRSLELDRRPGTLFTLAECEAKRGRMATAVARYDEYLALYATLPADKKSKQGDRERVSREARAALLAQVPELTLVLPPDAPRGTEVTCDGIAVKTSELGTPIRVDPGPHVVLTHVPGGPASTARIVLGPGERKGIALRVVPVEAAAPPPPAPATAGQRVAAGVTGGVGLALVATGAVLGSIAKSRWNDVLQRCKDPVAGTGCAPSDQSQAENAGRLADGSTATLVAGGAAVVTGVVLWLTAPPVNKAPAAAWRLLPGPRRGGAAVMLERSF
jgi:hypothetical protein